MFFNKFAPHYSIPYFNLFFYFIEDGLVLALNRFWWFTHIVSQVVFFTSNSRVAQNNLNYFLFWAIFHRGHVWVFTLWTCSCFLLGLEGTFAFYTFPTFWWETFIMLKMKVIYLKFLWWGFFNRTLTIYVLETT